MIETPKKHNGAIQDNETCDGVIQQDDETEQTELTNTEGTTTPDEECTASAAYTKTQPEENTGPENEGIGIQLDEPLTDHNDSQESHDSHQSHDSHDSHQSHDSHESHDGCTRKSHGCLQRDGCTRSHSEVSCTPGSKC